MKKREGPSCSSVSIIDNDEGSDVICNSIASERLRRDFSVVTPEIADKQYENASSLRSLPEESECSLERASLPKSAPIKGKNTSQLSRDNFCPLVHSRGADEVEMLHVVLYLKSCSYEALTCKHTSDEGIE